MAAQLENMKQDRESMDADTLAKYSRYFDIVLTRGRKIKNYAMNEKHKGGRGQDRIFRDIDKLHVPLTA